MSRRVRNWTEDLIAEYFAQGRGQGRLASYLPWIQITDFYSKGRSHYRFSQLTGRNHELLSDGEYFTFAMLEWRRDNIDIREQFPLDRDITLEVAKELGIRHPHYPRTRIATVMTLDFLATRLVNGKEDFVAYSVKQQEDLNNPEVIEKLEIERSLCDLLGFEYHLIIKERLPMTTVRNLLWIRDAQLEPDMHEEHPGFFEEHMNRLSQSIANTNFKGSLVDYCSDFDSRLGVAEGTSLRAIRMLLANRTLTMDMNNPAPERAPLATFTFSTQPSLLRRA